MSESKFMITGAVMQGVYFDKPTRTMDNAPRTFRQARKPDGNIVLQGGYLWSEGLSKSGIEWRELPIVDVDTNGIEIQQGGVE